MSENLSAVSVRPRTPEDLDALAALLREIHRIDRYPTELPPQPRDFLATTNELATWVLTVDDRPLGHVALHTIWSDDVAELATRVLRRGRNELASVSRLFVASQHRRSGHATTLLDLAVTTAEQRGLLPILDVNADNIGANHLYRTLGWIHLGTIGYPLADGRVVDEHVYRAPDAPHTDRLTRGASAWH